MRGLARDAGRPNLCRETTISAAKGTGETNRQRNTLSPSDHLPSTQQVQVSCTVAINPLKLAAARMLLPATWKSTRNGQLRLQSSHRAMLKEPNEQTFLSEERNVFQLLIVVLLAGICPTTKKLQVQNVHHLKFHC